MSTPHESPADLPGTYREIARSRPFALVSDVDPHVAAGVPLGPVTRLGRTLVAPFAAVEIDGVSDVATGVRAGLLTAEGDGVEVTHDRGRLSIEVTAGGRTDVVARARMRHRPRRLAFVAAENQVVAVVDTGTGWRPRLAARDEVAARLDLRDPDLLARLSHTWGAIGVADTVPPQTVDVRAGSFGLTGVRDPHLVQRPDGTPWSDGETDRVWLTATCAGPGFFPQAHWGVFSFSPTEPAELRPEAELFFLRDGRVLGDHAGQLVVDDDRDEVVLLVSSWGDFTPARGVHVRHAVGDRRWLRGTHLIASERYPLPTPHSAWDPALTRIDDRWHVAYVESPSQDPFDFRPALARGESGAAYDAGLQQIGADTSLHQTEGPILARVGGEWRLLASDGHARTYPAYDLRMRRVGTLDAPYGTNIPHPVLVPVASPHGAELLVTFDGTPWGQRVVGYGTHGDHVVMARD